VAPVVLLLFTNPVIGDEWEKYRIVIRLTEHIRGQLWHIFSVAINQVMMAKYTLNIYLEFHV
jgi:hypothetical protein